MSCNDRDHDELVTIAVVLVIFMLAISAAYIYIDSKKSAIREDSVYKLGYNDYPSLEYIDKINAKHVDNYIESLYIDINNPPSTDASPEIKYVYGWYMAKVDEENTQVDALNNELINRSTKNV